MMPEAILLLKDTNLTRIMQAIGVFESWKFVGTLLKVSLTSRLGAKSLLMKFKESKSPVFEIVGVIIPNKKSCILSGYTVISTGTTWATVEAVCTSYNSVMEILS